ncbi:MAG: hypothetical protein VX519_08570 [Myxococcota bacterium]|nr:hypothetical protein [Myxococcota bacterium]
MLRMVRVPLRWDEWTWQYLAYDARTWEALTSGRLLEALTTFSGLHPPLFPLLHSAQELALPIPGLVLLASACASIGAVVIAYRLHPIAWVLVATSPLQVAYAAEANNYPLATLAIAIIFLAHERVKSGGSPLWLGAAALLGFWTHLLAGWVGLVAASSLGKRTSAWVLGVLVLGTSVLWEPTLALITEPGTWRQPPVRPWLMAKEYLVRFGPGALLLAPLALRGARTHKDIAWIWASTLMLIWVLQAAGIAAPHQFPYYLALGVPWAMLVAAGAQSKRAHQSIAAIVTLHTLWLLWLHGSTALGMLQDSGQTRAIDVALQEAKAGDGLYLLAPPLVEDDDKSAHSEVLQRISPWQPLPTAHPSPFDYLDHRHGQPRDLHGITVYVNDHPRDVLNLAISAHGTLFLVVYDHREDPRYTTELTERIGSSPERIEEDLIWRLQMPDSDAMP